MWRHTLQVWLSTRSALRIPDLTNEVRGGDQAAAAPERGPHAVAMGERLAADPMPVLQVIAREPPAQRVDQDERGLAAGLAVPARV